VKSSGNLAIGMFPQHLQSCIHSAAYCRTAPPAAVLLVTGYVTSALPAALITAFVTGVFGLLWFALPLTRRR